MTQIVGTPDWQRGVVSAGKLLATMAAGTSTVTVAVPPNARSLVVCLSYVEQPAFVEVKGTTTGRSYVGNTFPADIQPAYSDSFYVFDVASQLDAEVTISLPAATTDPWYVYSSTATSILSIPDLSATMANPVYLGSPPGITIIGWDGTPHAQALATDKVGRLAIMPPTDAVSLPLTVASEQILARSTTGGYYLFGYDVYPDGAMTAGTVEVLNNGVLVSAVVADPSTPCSIDLKGFYTFGPVEVSYSGTNASIVLRYGQRV